MKRLDEAAERARRLALGIDDADIDEALEYARLAPRGDFLYRSDESEQMQADAIRAARGELR